jgi:hypothetical protein
MPFIHGGQTRADPPGEMIMTQDKAKKAAARQRMAETGEPYSVARHAVENEAAGAHSAADAGGVPAEAGKGRSYVGQARDLADRARRRADQAQVRADQVQEAADQAQERAERAEEAASMADAATDMAAEAAYLIEGWADAEEQARAHGVAAQARDATRETQRRPARAK